MRALVWKRSDLRESSRLVTLWTRERGRIGVLAKGAHRPKSALLGKIDLLNELEVTLTGRGVPLFGRVRLVHEPRALRHPERFFPALYLVQLLDACLLDERPDPALFDLTIGAIRLIERTPTDRIATVVSGIEVKLLDALGSLPGLDRCAACDSAERPIVAVERDGSPMCRMHASAQARPFSKRAIERVRALQQVRGRELPGLDGDPAHGEVVHQLQHWLANGIDRATPLRGMALRRVAPASSHTPGNTPRSRDSARAEGPSA